jgi:hypothetical protein
MNAAIVVQIYEKVDGGIDGNSKANSSQVLTAKGLRASGAAPAKRKPFDTNDLRRLKKLWNN